MPNGLKWLEPFPMVSWTDPYAPLMHHAVESRFS